MSNELKTVADYTKALKALGKEVKRGTKLPQLKAAYTRATKATKPEVKPQAPAKKPASKPVVKKTAKAVDPKRVFGKRFQTYTLRKILPKGHTKTHYHCLANEASGNKVTLHVPKSAIDPKPKKK